MKDILLVIFFSFALFNCGDKTVTNIEETVNTYVSPVSSKNRVIYEINVRNYSAAGTFKAVQTDLPRLKELGADIIWLMPIHPIGQEKKNGSLGSPYAVQDYKAINPDLGSEQDFKDLIKAAHALSIDIWMDWVANHTAWDHDWVTSHLNYYAEKNGQRPYAPNGWEDVAQLDYNNAQLREAMIDAMKYWVREFDIDGYRCDAATFVPLPFWTQARTEVDAIKQITWLCEGDNAAYMKVFDYDYAWAFNDALNEFGTGSDISGLVSACQALNNNPAYQKKGRMLYLTNHDLNAHHGTEFSRYGANVLPLTVLYYTIYDMPLVFYGQETGRNQVMSLFDKDPLNWEPANKNFNTLFTKLSNLKRTQPALEDGEKRGKLSIIPTSNPNVFVYSRKRDLNEVLVLLNFNNAPVNFKWSSTFPSGTFTDFLTGEKKIFSKESTVFLPEKGYSIFVK